MSIRAGATAKTIGLLLATLLVGALLGAAITGHVVRKRVATFNSFTSADGFSTQLMEFVDPVDAEQRTAIAPIIDRHGAAFAGVIDETRGELTQIMDDLERSLAPHLNAEQLEKIRDRRKTLRDRLDRLPQESAE